MTAYDHAPGTRPLVGILLFDEVEVLDFAGPYEVCSGTRDPAGDPLMLDPASCSANQFGTCSFQTDLTLPASGTYQLAISDSGINEPGTYESVYSVFSVPAPIN